MTLVVGPTAENGGHQSRENGHPETCARGTSATGCTRGYDHMCGMKVVQWTVWYAPGGNVFRDINAITRRITRAMTYKAVVQETRNKKTHCSSLNGNHRFAKRFIGSVSRYRSKWTTGTHMRTIEDTRHSRWTSWDEKLNDHAMQ